MRTMRGNIILITMSFIVVMGMAFIAQGLQEDKGAAEDQISGMEFMHTYSQQEEGLYTYTLEATWDKLPVHSDTDTIGIRIMNSQVNLDSAILWYEADKITRKYNQKEGSYRLVTDMDETDVEVESVRVDLPIERVEKKAIGNWQGIEGHITMPKDSYQTDQSVTYENIRLVLVCDGRVLSPSQSSYFNIEAYYQHGSQITTNYEELYYDVES